jgi:glycosyltransferase involved in cell wall biosynthesis
VLTPSDATRGELLELGFRPELVTAVPNGVSEMFRPGGERSAEPLVVAVGRFAPVKRFDELIRAALVAKQAVPAMRLDLVGSGPMDDELRALVREHAAESWVTFHGHLEHEALVALYQRAWIVASASLAEGWD